MIAGSELIDLLADPRSGLVVTPLVDADRQIGAASIDIRLGPDIIVGRRATGATAFDPADEDAFRQQLEQRQMYIRRGVGDPFHLQPGEFVIARSLEYVALPTNISAEALGRSSWGRLGLVIATATFVEPGFKGTVTLELANVGNTPLVMHVGLRVAQLVFSRDSGARKQGSSATTTHSKRLKSRVDAGRMWNAARTPRNGRYNGQVKPESSRLWRDEDLRWVTPIGVKYVLGIVGDRFAGKSSAMKFLIGHRRFRLYRLSQFVYEEAQRRGMDVANKAHLRDVGDEMRQLHGNDVLARLAFYRIRSDHLATHDGNPGMVLIEGFRHPAELKAWQSLRLYRTLCVTASVSERLRRADSAGFLLDEPDQPPSDPLERLAWFEDNLDRGVRDSGVMGQAHADSKTVVLDTTQGGIPRMNAELRLKVRELDRWWRAREY